MNNLSLLIYAADVLPKFSQTILWAGIISVCAFFIIGMFDSHDYPFQGWVEKGINPKWLIILGVILLTFSSLIPERKTFYLIAGSEAGESVVTSQEGKEILNDIHEVIKHQLNTLKGE